jgi:predicted amidohydrolase YtcJ
LTAVGGGADLVVHGRIATLAGDLGFGWVDAIAVAAGRVVAAGTRDAVEPAVRPGTRRLVFGAGLAIVPGLTDAHLHLKDAAVAARHVHLDTAASLEDGLVLIAAAAAHLPDADAWMEGGGWDPADWGRWPRAEDLRAVARDRRVALWSHDRHALWVSEAVLRELGIDRSTPDPAGGALRRDRDGEPNGVLQEAATELVIARLPVAGAADIEGAVETYGRSLVALGLVGVHDPGDILAGPGLAPGFRATVALGEAGRLPLRVHCSVRSSALEEAIATLPGTGQPLGEAGGRVRMGWLKLFADGALGSRTALLLDPYEGSTDDRGIVVTSPERLIALVEAAARAGIASQVHAIGDAALRNALTALEPSATRVGPMPRVEHVQFADPADLPRLARARIAASIQPIHLRSDAGKARSAWGGRAERRGFPVRSLLQAGVVVAFGTDAPVESPDPWPGIALAVTRTAPEWADGAPFGPDQAVSLADAIRAATVGPAVAAGQSDGGRLTPGSRADFIAIPAASLAEPVVPGGPLAMTRPEVVALEGEIVFEA